MQNKRSKAFLSRKIKLNNLGFGSYYEYIQSDRWIQRREAYEKGSPKDECFCCGSYRQLCLHHLSYKNLGQEIDSDLVWVCKDCHEGLHKLSDWDLGEKLAEAHLEYKKRGAPQKKKKKVPKSDQHVPKPRRVVTVTLQQNRVDKLRQLASLKSDEQSSDVTYSDLIREAIDCYKVEKRKPQGLPCG